MKSTQSKLFPLNVHVTAFAVPVVNTAVMEAAGIFAAKPVEMNVGPDMRSCVQEFEQDV